MRKKFLNQEIWFILKHKKIRMVFTGIQIVFEEPEEMSLCLP